MLSKTSMTHPVILWSAVVLSVSGTVPNGEKRPLAAIDEAGYDCADLPKSMNGEKFKKGCPGAVWSSGEPSKDYCTNTGYSNGRFQWWKVCCKWKGGKCVADCSRGDWSKIKNCCTPTDPCDEWHGDCDKDTDCKGALFCGKDNCDSSKFSKSYTDCCTKYRSGTPVNSDNCEINRSVKKGNDWEYGSQDGVKGRGVITQCITYMNKADVKWESGQSYRYRIGDQGSFDINYA